MFFTTLDCNGRELLLDRPRVCGIVNVTSDSFSDGGRFLDPQQALDHALRLVEEGADLLDIGAESTRPGAGAIAPQEQISRVVPLIEAIAKQCRVPISIDTSDAEVMRAAVGAGAGLINDVCALRREGAMDAAAALAVPICLMHMQGEPRTMQETPYYDDVVGEVHRFLTDRLFACQLSGIDKKKVLVDPGFGFGKTLEHNLALLRECGRFAEIAPLFVGLSRKSMIGKIIGRDDVLDRVSGSVAAALIAVQNGAAIVRVHDVRATCDAISVWRAVGTASVRKDAKKAIWDDE